MVLAFVFSKYKITIIFRIEGLFIILYQGLIHLHSANGSEYDFWVPFARMNLTLILVLTF